MPNSIVILRKVFKFEVNPISRNEYKVLAFFSLLKKIPYVVTPNVCPSVCPSVRQSVRPSVRPSVRVRLSVRPCTFVCPSVRLSVCRSGRPSLSIIYFRGNLISSRHGHDLWFNLILLKIDIHVRVMVMYV